jgi:hypothetical protein
MIVTAQRCATVMMRVRSRSGAGGCRSASPRARTADGAGEVELRACRHVAARDQVTAVVLARMLAGVSTRRYARTGEPVGSDVDELARSTSKSAVSREFVSRTCEHLIELMSRPL